VRYACQEKLIPGATDDERIARARDFGFEGVEINARLENALRDRAKSLAAAFARAGCAAAAVCGGYRGWLGHFDAEARALAVRDIIELLPIAADIGACGVIVPAAYGMFSRSLPPFNPPRGEAEDRTVLLDSLRAVGETAARHGMTIYLEPLNRYEDHMVNTFAQAGDLVRAAGSGALQPMIDVFHAGIEERDIAKAIRGAAVAPGYVHLADSNRLEPGQGHTSFGQVLAALAATGFSGWCSFECGLSGPAPSVLPTALALLKALERVGPVGPGSRA
jgi:sugar phosphate isomerase/epimerase